MGYRVWAKTEGKGGYRVWPDKTPNPDKEPEEVAFRLRPYPIPYTLYPRSSASLLLLHRALKAA
jgi:hypothetical protein